MKITIGTRGSQLALWQTNWVKSKLQQQFPSMTIAVQEVKTTGDKILDVPLAKIGDKGLFTKELDIALLSGKIDIAVHSMKDVPTRFEPGLTIGAVTQRWDVRDALISRNGTTLDSLPEGARLATGSLRRKAQLKYYRPDFQIIDIRGNVPTRLRKFDDADWDAMILACAGLQRLQLDDRITQKIPLEIMLPAVGQGCFAVMCRQEDQSTLQILAELHKADVASAVFAERAMLRTLEGGCQVPIGAFAEGTGQTVLLKGCVASLEGEQYFKDEITFTPENSEKAGQQLADTLLKAGAKKILDEIREQN